MLEPHVFYVALDHHELAIRFGGEDPQLRQLIEGPDPEPSELAGDREGQLEELLNLMELLPAKEYEMVRMFYFEQKLQDHIAYIHGCTQAAVSYRIGRAIERLKFLAALPKLPDDEIEALLTPHFGEADLAVLMTYRHTASQSKSADQLGISQGRVRHRLIKSVARLEEIAKADPTFKEVAKLFCMLRDHPNVLFEVQLPQWQHQGKIARDDNFAK